jgi:hypothetical protein
VQRGGPPLLIGGTGPAAIRRTTALGPGWIAGGGIEAGLNHPRWRPRATVPFWRHFI